MTGHQPSRVDAGTGCGLLAAVLALAVLVAMLVLVVAQLDGLA